MPIVEKSSRGSHFHSNLQNPLCELGHLSRLCKTLLHVWKFASVFVFDEDWYFDISWYRDYIDTLQFGITDRSIPKKYSNAS